MDINTEAEMLAKIEAFKGKVEKWCKDRDAWTDTYFHDWLEYHDDEPPEYPCAAFLTSEGELGNSWNGYSSTSLFDEFCEFVDEQGFEFEQKNAFSLCFYFPEKEDATISLLRSNYEWRWICSLIKPEFSCLYEEIFDRLLKKPEELTKIGHRQFEYLLDGIFQNNGYRTQIGKGSGDGGVDLRLFSNDVIGEVVTLVQAKRYDPKNPIDLSAVQALTAVVDDERANRGLFVTTSRYLPCAQKFAARQNSKIKLAQPQEIAEWMQLARTNLIRDKSKAVSKEHVLQLLTQKPDQIATGLEGTIFHTTWGYNCTHNLYALLLRESKGAALMMELPSKLVGGDWQIGSTVPVTDPSALINLNSEKVFRVKKSEAGQDLSLWGNGHLFHPWGGKPDSFNAMD